MEWCSLQGRSKMSQSEHFWDIGQESQKSKCSDVQKTKFPEGQNSRSRKVRRSEVQISMSLDIRMARSPKTRRPKARSPDVRMARSLDGQKSDNH